MDNSNSPLSKTNDRHRNLGEKIIAFLGHFVDRHSRFPDLNKMWNFAMLTRDCGLIIFVIFLSHAGKAITDLFNYSAVTW